MSTASQFFHALWLSLAVSGSAALISAVIGIPLGALLSDVEFPGRKTILTIVHALMGLPPVVVGLYTFLVIIRTGPLGSVGLVYTVPAMVIVQVILATPIIACFTHASLSEVDPRLAMQAMSLCATRTQATIVKIRKAREGMVASVIAGFGRVIAEVGAVTIVGGAITGKTDTITTLIVKQTRQGVYTSAALLGLVLIAISILVNVFLTRLQAGKGASEIGKRVTGYID